ncbi:MAG TPA: helix-turn-helix domain-containing protein [Mycobacteriales bacterium]|nr:helix-turn-helix domain-containing protein [Mycobacteriales bacterium]
MEASRIGKREQILQTALELFSTQGYDSTSLRQIADQQGLTKAALYYHFPAKELLLIELVRPFIEGLSELVTEYRARDKPDAEALLSSYLDLFLTHLDLLGLLAGDPATLHHPDIGQRLRTLVMAMRSSLAGPEPSAERGVRAACALGVINAVPQLPPDVVQSSRATILAAALSALGESPSTSKSRRTAGR